MTGDTPEAVRYREAIQIAGGCCIAHGHRTTNVELVDGEPEAICPECYDYYHGDPRPEAWAEPEGATDE